MDRSLSPGLDTAFFLVILFRSDFRASRLLRRRPQTSRHYLAYRVGGRVTVFMGDVAGAVDAGRDEFHRGRRLGRLEGRGAEANPECGPRHSR